MLSLTMVTLLLNSAEVKTAGKVNTLFKAFLADAKFQSFFYRFLT